MCEPELSLVLLLTSAQGDNGRNDNLVGYGSDQKEQVQHQRPTPAQHFESFNRVKDNVEWGLDTARYDVVHGSKEAARIDRDAMVGVLHIAVTDHAVKDLMVRRVHILCEYLSPSK